MSADAPLAGGMSQPFDLRNSLLAGVLSPAAGFMGGAPASPSSMLWLWPLADADEGKIIVSGTGSVGPGQVGLLSRLNGTNHWTDPSLAGGTTAVRAVHFDEAAQAVEWLTRGRWELPIYFADGIFSAMPDTPWIGEIIANSGSAECRSIGFIMFRDADQPPHGLTNVQVRSTSCVTLTADTNCTVALYRCLRPVSYVSGRATWNKYLPQQNLSWSSPGGIGGGDADFLGTAALSANVPGQIGGSAVAAALGAMISGQPPGFLVRRVDQGGATISIAGSAVVEFDLVSPPN